jgi:hypothetical protein
MWTTGQVAYRKKYKNACWVLVETHERIEIKCINVLVTQHNSCVTTDIYTHNFYQYWITQQGWSHQRHERDEYVLRPLLRIHGRMILKRVPNLYVSYFIRLARWNSNDQWIITLVNKILSHERFIGFLTNLFTLNPNMQSKFFHHPQFLYNSIFNYRFFEILAIFFSDFFRHEQIF